MTAICVALSFTVSSAFRKYRYSVREGGRKEEGREREGEGGWERERKYTLSECKGE